MYIAVMVGVAVMGLGLGLLLLLMQHQHARSSTHVTILSADKIAWIRRSGRLVRKVQLDRM